MSRRKVGQVGQEETRGAKVYREEGEYIVVFYQDGRKIIGADYFTDDKNDAFGTAKMHVGETN